MTNCSFGSGKMESTNAPICNTMHMIPIYERKETKYIIVFTILDIALLENCCKRIDLQLFKICNTFYNPRNQKVDRQPKWHTETSAFNFFKGCKVDPTDILIGGGACDVHMIHDENIGIVGESNYNGSNPVRTGAEYGSSRGELFDIMQSQSSSLSRFFSLHRLDTFRSLG